MCLVPNSIMASIVVAKVKLSKSDNAWMGLNRHPSEISVK